MGREGLVLHCDQPKMLKSHRFLRGSILCSHTTRLSLITLDLYPPLDIIPLARGYLRGTYRQGPPIILNHDCATIVNCGR